MYMLVNINYNFEISLSNSAAYRESSIMEIASTASLYQRNVNMNVVNSYIFLFYKLGHSLRSIHEDTA